MKKLLTFFAVLAILFSLVSCGNEATGTGATLPPFGSTTSAPTTVLPSDDLEKAKYAYALLDAAEKVCVAGMEDIYNVWYFGIYDAPDCTEAEVLSKIALNTSLTESELAQYGGYPASYLVNGTDDFPAWEYCLWSVENCFKELKVYEAIALALEEAKTTIQAIPEDFKYTAPLKTYYLRLSEYAKFFNEPLVSFNDLTPKRTEYENKISEIKETLTFDLAD